MKHKLNISFLLLLLVLTVSCSEDFLQIPTYVYQNSETFLTNDENAIDAVTAVYAVTRGEETYGKSTWIFGDTPSDDSETGGDLSGNDQPNIQEFDRMIYKSDNPELLNYWKGMYIGIFRANWFISGMKDNTYVTPSLAKQLVGETRFLRAVFHFDLMKVFGGVTIRNEESEFTISPVRNSISEVLHFIEDELITASTEMGPLPFQGQQGRVTAGTAKALLIKAYVFESSYANLRAEGKDPNNLFEGCENKWNLARDLADELISNKGLYGYMLDPDYYNLWREAGEGSPENVFIAKGTRLVGHVFPGISMGQNEWGASGGSGTVISTWLGCRGTFVLDTLTGARIDSVDNYDRGYGFNSPTQELVDAFNPQDPRRDASIVFNFSDSTIRTRNGETRNFRLATFASPTGYCSEKYLLTEPEWAPGDLGVNSSSGDVRLIRFADVLLWGAEAHLNTDDPNPAKAIEYVNLLRKRARESGKPMPSSEPADLASITLEDVYKERRLELALEGHRYFDLVRLGRAYENITGQYNNSIDGYLTFENNKMEFFPIPASELDASGNSLKQNPGY
jgi:hypothetical protein